MSNAERADRFLAMVPGEGTALVISGDAARCLWTLAHFPSLEQWKRLCRPWPEAIDVLGDGPLPADCRADSSRVAQECAQAMRAGAQTLTLPQLGEVRLAPATFILAEILTDDSDPLRVTRVADILRVMPEVDLEEVRAILKAVSRGELFETLLQVAYVTR